MQSNYNLYEAILRYDQRGKWKCKKSYYQENESRKKWSKLLWVVAESYFQNDNQKEVGNVINVV